MDERDDAGTGTVAKDGAAPQGLPERLSELANRWLRDRFALRDADGATAVAADLGARAEQFVRGFFRGLLEREDGEAGGGEGGASGIGGATGAAVAPALAELLPRVAQAQKLIARTGHTVASAFQSYLREHVAPPAGDGAGSEPAPIVIDGRFVVRHGTQLVGRMVQALGGVLASDEAPPEEPADRIPVKLDFAGLFRSLVVGAREPTPEPTQPTSPNDKEST